MYTITFAALSWISRLTRIKSIETWTNRFFRYTLIFTRVRGEYADYGLCLSITAFNPSRVTRVIRDLTLHFRIAGTPHMFRLADTAAGVPLEKYKLPAHCVSNFSCKASMGDHHISEIATIHLSYLDENNFRHHVWIDAPGRFQPSDR
jgi:hypothetical protein